MTIECHIKDEEVEFKATGLERVTSRVLFWKLACLFCFPLLPLCLYWKPNWWAKLAYKRVPVHRATHLLIQRCEIVELVRIRIILDNGATIGAAAMALEADQNNLIDDDEQQGQRFFEFGAVRFMWDKMAEAFVRQTALEDGYEVEDIQANYSQGLTRLEREEKRVHYGENSIEIKVKSYMVLFIEEVLNPFYMFQIFAIILWTCDDYYSYAAAIFIISAGSIIVALRETKKQAQNLHDMVKDSSIMNRYSKDDDKWEVVDTRDLAPGDLVEIEHGTLHADILLLQGTAIVNEAMLTGESAPEQKEPAMGIKGLYNPEKHRRHTLFSGTIVVQARASGAATHVTGVIVRTGFSTAKGGLVRSIMFPAPIGFGFYDDAIKFICLLGLLALAGDCYCFYLYYTRHAPWTTAILRILDLITVVVPPSLPAAMTIGTVYSQGRLIKKKIFCISPPRINVAGKAKICCFDKTGTLTEDGLDFWGVIKGDDLTGDVVHQPQTQLDNHSSLKQCMAACHSLTMIQGEFIGDPLDVKMFLNTGWHYQEAGADNFPTVRPITQATFNGEDDTGPELAVLKCFPFSSELQRQSVIVRSTLKQHPQLFLKGAPEAVAARCANMPACFEDELAKLTRRGFRVLGLAERTIEKPSHKLDKLDRVECEKELNFVGLLVMQNQLKKKTQPILRELADAGIRSLMVTGDNLLTGIAVARDCSLLSPSAPVFIVTVEKGQSGTPVVKLTREGKCGGGGEEVMVSVEQGESSGEQLNPVEQMIRQDQSCCIPGMEEEMSKQWHFAMSGKDWAQLRQHFPLRIPYIIQRGTVFARMGPDQKAQLIDELKKIDYQVVMCGDGANDCGALRTANVGVSLSDSEASVAAPFTASCGDISCIPELIREGRAALVTSFGIFKYMAMYSLIQFISVLILYTFGTNLGDKQFLWIDLAITTTVAVFMSKNGPYPKLVRQRPPGSLLNPIIIISFALQVIGVAISQAVITIDLHKRDWYLPMNITDDTEERVISHDNTVIFILSAFQYMMLAFIFSIGPPYRTRIWRNIPFLTSLFILAWATAIMAIAPGAQVAYWFDLDIYYPNSTITTEATEVPLMYRWGTLAVVLVHFLYAVLAEEFIAKNTLVQRTVKMLRGKHLPKSKFKRIELELESRGSSWLGATPTKMLGTPTLPRRKSNSSITA